MNAAGRSTFQSVLLKAPSFNVGRAGAPGYNRNIGGAGMDEGRGTQDLGGSLECSEHKIDNISG